MPLNQSFRALLITNRSSYPPTGGAALRNWQNINILKKYGQVGVLYISGEHEHQPVSTAPTDIDVWREYVIKKRPLWKALLGRVRTFFWWVTKIPPLTDITYDAAVANNLERILYDFQPDVVIFEEIWLYCYLSVVKKIDCKIVYDAHNAESQLYETLIDISSVKSISQKLGSIAALKLIRAREVGFLQQSNQVWACSEGDITLLSQTCAAMSKMVVIPNGVNTDSFQQSTNNLYCRYDCPDGYDSCAHTIIYTASFSYSPNIAAAHCLIDKIFPKLQHKYPDATLLLVGSNPTNKMSEAARTTPGIIVTGRVLDIQPYLAAASVAVVPLTEGGGTRLKILEAFAASCPVVSTEKGVEGIAGQDGVHLLVRKDVTAIVDAIDLLWQDSQLRKNLSENAYQLVCNQYSWEFSAQKIHSALKVLFPENFKTNFDKMKPDSRDRASIKASQKLLS